MQRAYTPSTSPPPTAFTQLSPVKLRLVSPPVHPHRVIVSKCRTYHVPLFANLPPSPRASTEKEKEENNMYLKPSEVVRRAEGSSNQEVHGKTKQTPAENHMMHKRRAGYTALPPRSSRGPSHVSWSTIIIQERGAHSSRPPRGQRTRTRTMPHKRVKVTCSCRWGGGGLGSWRGMFRRLQDQALALVATAGAVAR